MRVLDCCAAPGGKSFGAAIQMENRGEVVSFSNQGWGCVWTPSPSKISASSSTVTRVVFVMAVMGGCPLLASSSLAVSLLSMLERLPEVQRAILDNAARYVKPGGVMVYSTCTILRRENEDVAQTFLAHHPEFRAERFCLPENKT